MEPELRPELLVDAQMAIKELAILSAIPIVSFALWADYFIRSLQERRSNPTLEDPDDIDTARLKIRLFGTLTILFETIVYLGSPDLRDTHALICYSIFMVAILGQIILQNQVEQKILPPPTIALSAKSAQAQNNSDPYSSDDPSTIENDSEADVFRVLAKLSFSWMISGLLHAGLFFGFIYFGAFLAGKLHWTDLQNTFLVIFSGAVGMTSGFILNLASSPFQMKQSLPSSRIEDPSLKSLCERCFHKAGLTPPSFWMIDMKGLRIANPILSGLPFKKGLLQQTLFIPAITLKILNPPELEAILLNQVSHLVLHHLRKRIALALALIMASAFFALGLLGLAQTSFNTPFVVEGVGLLFIVLSLIGSYHLLDRQSKIHLFEADLYTINQLGVELEVLARALIKLDQLAEDHPTFLHPETKQRIRLLQAYCMPKSKTPSSEDADNDKVA